MNRPPACSHYSKSPNASLSSVYRPSLKTKIKDGLASTRTGRTAFNILRSVYRSLHLFTVVHDRYYSNNTLGIFITPVCNLACFNCQTSARQAPAKENMTVQQMESIVEEAVALEYYWDRIILTGGEATTHPQFFELLQVLERYRAFHPDCRFTLETNGVGKKVQSVLDRLPSWVSVNNSNKEQGQQSYAFVSYYVAPADILAYKFSDFSKGCSRLDSTYGLCATMYGYYPCSPCMNVARVFGLDVGIQKLSMVTEEALREQMKVLCKYCGWFKERPDEEIDTEQISRSWRKALAKYKDRKPALTWYR